MTTTASTHRAPTSLHELSIRPGRSPIAAQLVTTVLLALGTALLIHNSRTDAAIAAGWLAAAAMACLPLALAEQLATRAELAGTTLRRRGIWRRSAVDLAIADVWFERHRVFARGLHLHARDDSGKVTIPLEPAGRGLLSGTDLRALAAAIGTGPHRLPAEEYQAEAVVARLRQLAA
ncbi:MAG: hypothetical protein GEV07_12850 [Streptosporangiales bacterium]|nr:hypothetical protein [Streptosporangiales bacterium]